MNAAAAKLNPAEVERSRRRALRWLVFCTGLWALSFPTMKALLQVQAKLLPDAGTWFFSAFSIMGRFGLAGLVLLLFTWRQCRTLRGREVEQGLVLAGFGGVGILFQMDALAYTSASTSAFLTQGYCLFIPLWVALVNRRWPSLKVFASTALVLAGVGVLAEVNFRAFHLGRGEWETLVAALLFTGQILGLEHPRYAANRPLPMTVVMMLGIALVVAPVVAVTAPAGGGWWRAGASPAAAGLLAILVLACTLGGYTLMNLWQPKVSATEAGLIYCAEPVFASLFALFLPLWFSRWAGVDYANEHLTARLLLGGGLITVANVLLQSRWGK